jgi:hypothetical protein
MGEQRAIREGRWKLLGTRLFDLEEDVDESRDLAAARPEVVRDLEAKLRAWESGLMPPRWTNAR